MLSNYIGMFAAVTSVLAWLPQLAKTYKSKSVNDLSIGTLLSFAVTSMLWLWYGILISSWAVFTTNCLLSILAVWLLALKILYER